jgi:hypothetical protein
LKEVEALFNLELSGDATSGRATPIRGDTKHCYTHSESWLSGAHSLSVLYHKDTSLCLLKHIIIMIIWTAVYDKTKPVL